MRETPTPHQAILDVNFDFQAEVNQQNFDIRAGIQYRDSDRHSKTLQEYHRRLWSKPLPNGDLFHLTKTSQNRLQHNSSLGNFILSSDRAVPTWWDWRRLQPVVSSVEPEFVNDFYRTANTIGGILIWPSNRVDNKPTINQSRGWSRQTADRLDLTVECLRRFYGGQPSPLNTAFERYEDFFQLFQSFRGFVDFFLLNDFVSPDYESCIIAPCFESFDSEHSPVPTTAAEYRAYAEATLQLVTARNQRIAALGL